MRLTDLPLDRPVATVMLLVSLMAIGLLNLYSATGGELSGRFLQQLYWFILGTSAFLVVASIDYRQYNHYGYWIYAAGLVVLALTLVIGRKVKGSTRWIGYGPLGVQPSELIKITDPAGDALCGVFETALSSPDGAIASGTVS